MLAAKEYGVFFVLLAHSVKITFYKFMQAFDTFRICRQLSQISLNNTYDLSKYVLTIVQQ